MSKYQDILDVFEGRKPANIPWGADLSWWLYAQKSFGTLPGKYEGDGERQLHIDLDTAIYLPPCNPYNIETSCKFTETEKDGKIIRKIETPYGELTEILSMAVNELGVRVPTRWTHETLGIPQPEEGADVLSPAGQP